MQRHAFGSPSDKITARHEPAARSSKSDNFTANLGFEAKVWFAADKLRSNMDAGEYKHVVLGLISLKYIYDTFEEHQRSWFPQGATMREQMQRIPTKTKPKTFSGCPLRQNQSLRE